MTQAARGTLYLCPTPIGNMEDISDRVRRVLKSADLVATEDTRHTGRLLAALGIQARLISYHEHNERERAEQLLEALVEGRDVALVSDAGTPGISDPGYQVVRAAIKAGIEVVSIPGPVAAMVALAGSGLPTDSFAFHGFVPRRRGDRAELLDRVRYSNMTSILYESPQRLRQTLEELAAAMPDRPIVVARELTKKFEEYHRGTARQLADSFPRDKERGEIVLIVDRAPEDAQVEGGLGELPIQGQYDVLVASGIDRMEAMKIVARGHGVPKNVVYRTIVR